MDRQRMLVVGSPDLTYDDVRAELEKIVSEASTPVEIVLMCNKDSGGMHDLDWEIALDAGRVWMYQIVGFDTITAAVNYVKGHSVLIFKGSEKCNRCNTVETLAKQARKWYSRRDDKWNDHRINLMIHEVTK